MKKYIIFLLLALLSSLAGAQILVTAPTFPTVNTYISYAGMVGCYGGDNGYANVAVTTGTPPFSYNWGPSSPTGQGTSSVTNLWAGTWIVTVTDALGCVGTNWVLITQPDSLQVLYVVSGTTVGLLVTGGTLIPPDTYHYQWTPTPINGNDVSQATFPAGTTNVLVKVVDGHFCEKVVAINLATAGVADNPTEQISIYPNPVTDVLNINTGDLNITGIQLFDDIGKQINSFSGETKAIDFSAYSTGMYFVRFTTEDGQKIRPFKVLKQ
jgi:hypothetical protein